MNTMPCALGHGMAVALLNQKDMSDRRQEAQEDINFKILRLVQEDPHISQRELADRLGISLGGLNYCLRALVDKGFVKLERFKQSPQKLKSMYILTPMGMAEKMMMTGRFLRRKMQEYDTLKAEIEALKKEAASVTDHKTKANTN
jgi:EPS-associated MarR family transcriptional regulator